MIKAPVQKVTDIANTANEIVNSPEANLISGMLNNE